MKGDRKGAIARAATLGSYALMGGVALWRALRGEAPGLTKPGGIKARLQRLSGELDKKEALRLPALPPGAQRGDVPPTGPQVRDLSLSTPGNEELDRLVRTARADEREERQHGEPAPPPPFGERPLPWTHESPVVAAVLAYQLLESPRLEGWHNPRPEKLPLPTYVPAIMAFGIVMFAMGLVTSWYVCTVGAGVFAIAAIRWVQELQGD